MDAGVTLKSMLSTNVFGEVVRLGLLVNVLVAVTVITAQAAETAPIRIVAYGDSLTAGYRLKASEAFPDQLAKALKEGGRSVDITNAGVSGDTTAAGLERFDWAVPDKTEAVILELGANDALRGVDPKETRANLDKIMSRLHEKNIEILLAGMLAPKNWGPEYEQEFNSIYKDLSAKYDAVLYPFFLDGVALDAKLTLDDGLHPSAPGVAKIVERIRPSVDALIARVETRRTAAAKP